MKKFNISKLNVTLLLLI